MGRDKVLKRSRETRHPSSSPVVGAGRASVSAPPVPWCRALVATGVVHTKIDICITKDQLVDLLTKSLGVSKFMEFQ